MAAISAATNLLLRLLSTEHDPYTWALPAAVGVSAIVTVALADPLARAIRSLRS